MEARLLVVALNAAMFIDNGSIFIIKIIIIEETNKKNI